MLLNANIFYTYFNSEVVEDIWWISEVTVMDASIPLFCINNIRSWPTCHISIFRFLICFFISYPASCFSLEIAYWSSSWFRFSRLDSNMWDSDVWRNWLSIKMCLYLHQLSIEFSPSPSFHSAPVEAKVNCEEHWRDRNFHFCADGWISVCAGRVCQTIKNI